MANDGPAILSIAMLASLALGGGGAWLIANGRDRRRGWLMVVMALVLIGNVAIFALP